MSPAKSQMGSRSFTRALALAFNEWLLMLMLFVNSILSYVISKFADYTELQSPCLMCSRLDHILRKTKHLKKSHWNMVCSKHKSEISSLVYCHAHGKLVDVRGMCETCLFSFATTNKSNAETYRLLVGKLGEDSSFGSKSDQITNPRYCTCCHQMFMPQTVSTDPVAKPAMLSKIRLVGDVRTGKQSTPKKSVRFNHLPHVGYTELKIHSDTESEAEGVVVKEKNRKFQPVDLGTPPVITLPYDLATHKLLNLDFPLQPLVARNDREEVHFQEIGLRTNSFFPELIPDNDVSETPDKVLKMEDIISLDNLFLTSRAMEHPAAVLKEKEELFHLQVSLAPDFMEIPAEALMEETELIPVNDVSETSEKVLKEKEIISLDNFFPTSRDMEHPATVLKEKEELIHFQDVSLTPGFKKIPADALMEEAELITVNGVPETSEKVLREKEIISLDNLFLTSRAMEHPATVLKEKEELIHFQYVSLTPDFKEIPADALMEETELIPVNGVPETLEKVLKEEEVISLDDLSLTSRAMEYSAVFSKEKEGLIHPQDISVKPDFKENPANVLMEETELICLNNVCSKLVAAETSEDVLMDETELICLIDVSSTLVAAETSVDVLMEETELICLNDVSSTSSEDVLMGETELICLNDVSSTLVAAETSVDVLMRDSVSKEKEELILLQYASLTPEFNVNPAYALTEETELICLKDVTSTSVSAESPEDVLRGIELMPLHDISRDEVPESLTTNETSVDTSKERDTNQDVITSLESEDIVVSSTKSMPENSNQNCVSENKGMKETSLTVSSLSEMASHTEAGLESESSSFNSMSVAGETNLGSGELLDLNDAYNIIVHSESNKDSNRGAQIEQWMKKDTSRVSEDLKALLTQISASRGIEFLSPRDTSPKICSDPETKDLDHDMQMLIQKRMLERNESNLSLEGVSVSEIEGESESDRLKRQVDHDRKLLTGLYKELEEERSASAVATNQAMAMITRLQEEKSLFQMEALQNLRMMEEQAEYDMEAIQKLNDLLVEREKLIQDLEAEIDYLRDQTPQKKKLDNTQNVTEIDSSSERMSNKIQDCLTGFNEERLYITSCLEKIENRVQTDVNAHVATQESVSELHERVEKLKGDLYFLEHVVSSLGHGNEGVKFVKEIASHLQTLRSLSMKRQDHTES